MCGEYVQLSGDAGSVNRLPDYTVHQKTKKDGSPVEDRSYKEHSRWYSHRGHQGDHCATGMSGSAYGDWGDLSGFKARNIGSFTCVIYGQNQLAKSPLSYCPECKEMLKAMELWVGKMPKV
jgi:hypothetical protein